MVCFHSNFLFISNFLFSWDFFSSVSFPQNIRLLKILPWLLNKIYNYFRKAKFEKNDGKRWSSEEHCVRCVCTGVLGPAQETVPWRAHPQGDRRVQQTMQRLVVQSFGTGEGQIPGENRTSLALRQCNVMTIFVGDGWQEQRSAGRHQPGLHC